MFTSIQRSSIHLRLLGTRSSAWTGAACRTYTRRHIAYSKNCAPMYGSMLGLSTGPRAAWPNLGRPYLTRTRSRNVLQRWSSTSAGRAGNNNAIFYILLGTCTVITGAWLLAIQTKNYKLVHQLQHNTLLSWSNTDAGRYWTLFTSAVTHISPTHFIFNMFALRTFLSVLGMVPQVTAPKIWLLCGGSSLASSLAFLLYDSQRSRAPGNKSRPSGSACGLSGVNMGLAAAAACLVPNVPMMLLFIPIPIPLYTVTAGFIALDLFYLNSNDTIGHSAHLGGFAFGLLYYLTSLRKLRIPGSFLGPKLRGRL